MTERSKPLTTAPHIGVLTGRRPRRFYPRMRVCQKCLRVTNNLEYHQAYFCYYFRLNPSDPP